ncbi:hypothetical protein M405DRAFT_824979 [Rhizopogon salebrosus TDB-379]|nr:hypothetical protein M405DRAFT_824979 [Rhizopogon salebrosus TDB-379]
MIYATRSRLCYATLDEALMEHCRWLRRRLLWQLHVLVRSCRGHVRDSVKKDPLDACFGKLYKDKILQVVVR